MIRINLLPARERARAAGRRLDMAVAALGLGVLALGLIGAHTWQRASIMGANRALRQVNQELEKIQGPFADVTRMEQQKQELREKLRVIAQLEAKKTGPVRMLADLSDAAPDKLWLTEFVDSGGTLKLTGLGVDEQTVADFLRRLGALSLFKTVDLDETSQIDQDGAKLKRFVIRARLDYAGPAPEPSPPVRGGAKPRGGAR
jgi:type IV pilus assembly protein PilN